VPDDRVERFMAAGQDQVGRETSAPARGPRDT
jgi:hypothetical protein